MEIQNEKLTKIHRGAIEREQRPQAAAAAVVSGKRETKTENEKSFELFSRSLSLSSDLFSIVGANTLM